VERARQILARAARRRLALPERGVEIALLDWGGDGPLVLLHHANGFCKGTWGLVAEGLRDRFRVVAMDARGHGDSTQPQGPDAFAWDHFAADLLAVAEHVVGEGDAGRVAVGVGHSFGGTATLAAAARRPELFERIVLVDPVTPPPPAGSPPERAAHVQGLVDGARKRRADWPSREEARAWWAERELFAGWRPEALDLYALDGLREAQGVGVALKCPGAVEAAVFGASGGFDVFAAARGTTTPALWLWAARGSFPRPLYEELAGSMAAARVETLDCGHLVPMERPEWVVDAVCRFAAEGA
jgi:pimeloyl-ACP methyl ester carboxylesterase